VNSLINNALFIFVRFPLKNKELLSKWITAMRRDKWKPSSHDVLCSEHFEQTCFRFYSCQVRLREDAVPSVFSFPQHLHKTSKQRRAIIKHDVCNVSDSGASISTETSSNVVVASGSVLQHHDYALLVSPGGVKRKYAEMLNREKHSKQLAIKKLKVARRRLFRQQMKISSMKDIIQHLKSMGDVNSAAIELIDRCFGNIPSELLKRKLYHNSREAYSDTLRSFAMTLHFYSAKAYNFVRSSFRCALPHPSTLRSWYSAVDGKPGFTHEAFEVRYDFFAVVYHTVLVLINYGVLSPSLWFLINR
jgi:THAP domain